MQVTNITPIVGAATPPLPTTPFAVLDHDGTLIHADCMCRVPCDPPAPPVLVDHDGTPWEPPHGGHGRA